MSVSPPPPPPQVVLWGRSKIVGDYPLFGGTVDDMRAAMQKRNARESLWLLYPCGKREFPDGSFLPPAAPSHKTMKFPPTPLSVSEIDRAAEAFAAGEIHIAYKLAFAPGAAPRGVFLLYKRSGQYGFGSLDNLVPRDRGMMFVDKDKDLCKLLHAFASQFELFVFGRWDDLVEWAYAKPPVVDAIANLILAAEKSIGYLQDEKGGNAVTSVGVLFAALDDLGVPRRVNYRKELC